MSSARVFSLGFFKPAAYRGLQQMGMRNRQMAVSATGFSRDANAGSPSSPGMSLEDRVFEVVKKFEKVDAAKVTETARFTDDLALDSLDTVELVMGFEDEFKLEIPDEDADKIMTVQDAIDYLKTRSSEIV
ncbi:Acyl carrier protein [Porphyridium purpureum]|uniref:Acyl carrier protein n=1 Tax=Porphyridium purpureum TaxID=35688 RepID=A0A5J4Z874_PORPP|nr:Acyl carrier protein [Porphyridium purpureum]|eukprot:POR6026..scf295_1